MANPLLHRTRFAGDIVTEFLPPAKHSNKVAILLVGCPAYPGSKGRAMRFLAKKGYWVFLPRYRGTWESDGIFLAKSPHEDVIDLMDGLAEEFSDFWSGATFRLPENPEIYLIGNSFGGPAAILASADPRVKKAVAISPVIDWKEQEKTVEPLHLMSEYLPLAFGAAYRGDPAVWTKLAAGDFYNPADAADSLDGKKLLITHAKNDMVVHYTPAERFARDIGARFVPFSYAGHMSLSDITKRNLWKHVNRFLRGK